MAEDELRALTDELRRQHPSAVWDKEYLQSSPGGHLQVMQPQMYQMAAIVGILTMLILVVACANLGGLLLARAVSRQHEMGIRIAIGATRARIFRQLCTESLLLATLGSLAGLSLGYLAIRVALPLMDAPKWVSATPDWRVLIFTMIVTLAAAVFFGLAPALQIVRQRQHRTVARQILVAAQVASSCVLLIVAGLLVRATHHALYSDPGFRYEQLLSVDSQLAHHGYNPSTARAYLDQVQARLLATPGVRSVALVKFPPLGHITDRQKWDIGTHPVLVYPNWVAPGFFNAMGIPLLTGRTFYPGEKNAVIVSESLARQQWPGQNPVGQELPNDDHKDIVIGVVGNARINALSDDDATEMYWPAQSADTPDMVVVARSEGESANLPAQAKAIAESLDTKIVPEVRQLKALYLDNMAQVEKVATTVSLIGMIAVLLACIGIVSLVVFTISQRSKEIAIRLALGSPASRALTAVLGQFSWPVSIGIAAGIAITAGCSRVLRFALYGVSNLDPLSYAMAIAVLAAILALAVFVPARRALNLDVARALHEE
jgi:predicted permease